MKEMCTTIPIGSCPSCGHRQFVVDEMYTSTYLTNRDGTVIDFSNEDYSAKGMCCNCHKVYDMMPTNTGFVPLTDLRRILLDYTPHVDNFYKEEVKSLANPMEANTKQ